MMPGDEGIDRLLDRGGVGFTGSAGVEAFYILFSPCSSPADEKCIELTFSREFVQLGDVRTDVVVKWGREEDVRAWLAALVEEFDVEVGPPLLEAAAIEFVVRSPFDDAGEEPIGALHPWRRFETNSGESNTGSGS